MSKFTYGIVGLGKVGYAICRKLIQSGQLKWVVTRKQAKEIDFPGNVQIYSAIEQTKEPVSVVAIATSDGVFEKIVNDICGISTERKICEIAFHLSGATSREVLRPLSEFGIKTLSLHPMQTFGEYRENIFDGIFWGCDCTADDFEIARRIISDIGGVAHLLDEKILRNKPLYHAIGVSVSNFLQGVVEFARLQCENLSLSPSEVLLPILRTSFENAFSAIEQGKQVPITGPVARADAERIKIHLENLKNHSQYADEYRQLTLFLASILHKQDKISEEAYNKMLEILKEIQ
ncbi:MAG: DUF2520 domain-containing protein [Ignavibacteria bacterium]|nr:DUF2520 domain-containing protein [Ignavibacteria bacterium]